MILLLNHRPTVRWWVWKTKMKDMGDEQENGQAKQLWSKCDTNIAKATEDQYLL